MTAENTSIKSDQVVVQLAPGLMTILENIDQKLDKIIASEFNDPRFITPKEFQEKYRIPRSSYTRYVREGHLNVYTLPGTNKKYISEVEVIEQIKMMPLFND